MLFYPGNVTAILGKPALLNCRVAGVGNKTVSWLRHEGTHLLTAGRYGCTTLHNRRLKLRTAGTPTPTTSGSVPSTRSSLRTTCCRYTVSRV